MGRKEGKKEGEKKGGRGKEEGQSLRGILVNFQMRLWRRLGMIKWHVQWVGQKGLGWSCPVCGVGQALHDSVLLFCMSFSYQKSNLSLIFCSSRAEPCMCYGPYVETCLSTASQMVPPSTRRSHAETFKGSVRLGSTGRNACCDVIPSLVQAR